MKFRMYLSKGLFVFAILLALIACNKKTAAQPAKKTLEVKAIAKGLAPDETEARNCAEAFEKAVAATNKKQVNTLLDWDALLERATGDVDCDPKLRERFAAGVKDSVRGEKGLGSEICAAIDAGGSYKLLRLHKNGDEQRALFRLLLPDSGGVNYHDLILAKNQKGQTRIVDIYIFLSSETMSTTVRRAFLPIAAQAEKSILKRLTTQESDFIKNIDQLSQMAAARQKGDHQKVLTIYNRLPQSLQKDKLCLLLRLIAASNMDDKTYEKAIDAFRKAYPDDASIDLVSLDSFIFKKNYAGALKCLERIEKAIGGDAHLNVLRANIRVEMGDSKIAIDLAKEAIAIEPELEDAYWSLVTAAMNTKDWELVSETLISLEDEFQTEFEDLTKVEFYQPFTETPQYRQWLKRNSETKSKPSL